MTRRRQPDPVIEVPEWSNFGIGWQLLYGYTFGEWLDERRGDGPGPDAPMPSEDVLRAAWAVYRDRVEGLCFHGETPWAVRFDRPTG
jgi:hypothetical protein